MHLALGPGGVALKLTRVCLVALPFLLVAMFVDGTLPANAASTTANYAVPQPRGEVESAAVPPDHSLRFHIGLRPRDPALYASLVSKLGGAHSQPYTPSQWDALVQPDTSSLSNWLNNHGLRINLGLSSPLDLAVDGTVGDISSALHVRFGFVRSPSDGRDHVAALSQATLPSEVAGVVTRIVGLDEVPLGVPELASKFGLQSPSSSPRSSASPRYTGTCPSVVTAPLELTPTQIELSYQIQTSTLQFPPIYQGTGHLGLLGFSDMVYGDGQAFWTRERVPTPYPSVNQYFIQSGTTDCGFALEMSLDVEWAGAVAPGISFIQTMEDANTTSGWLDEYNAFYNTPSFANVVEASYGYADNFYNAFPSTIANQFGAAISNLAAIGIPYINAGGECHTGFCGVATNGPPASISPTIGVGGTDLQTDEMNDSTEEAWDSNYFGYYNEPGSTVGKENVDVSLDAAGPYYQAVFMGQNTDGWGGTSLAGPIVAGIYLVAKQYLGHTPAPTPNSLYYIQSHDSAAFNDITKDDNPPNCDAGTCSASGVDVITGVGTPHAMKFIQDLRTYGY